MWDPSKGGNEESVTNDEHKKMNLASLEMSRSSEHIIKYFDIIIFILKAYILLGLIVAANIIKLSMAMLGINKIYQTSKIKPSQTHGEMSFWEWFKFFACFVPSFMAMLFTFYLYTANKVQCPMTFYKYQSRFCECDLLERQFHKEQETSEYDLNMLCNTRYGTDAIYVETSVLFSKYLPSSSKLSTAKKGRKDFF